MSEDINVGAISEALNNKADRDMVNSIPPYVVSRTPNSQGGVVEIWSDGYCVQTGYVSSDGVVNLTQAYINTDYVLTFGSIGQNNGVPRAIRNINSFNYSSANYANCPSNWRTEGYIR